MPENESELRLEDRELIRDVLHRYCRAVDRRDLDLLLSCYHPDSVDQHASFTGSGPDFCRYAMTQVTKTILTLHRITNVLIEFENDRAFTECYVHSIHRVTSGDDLVDYTHYGRYCDILEKCEGIWRISYRLHLPDADSYETIREPAGRRSVGEKTDRYYVRGVPGPQDASYLRFGIPSLKRDVAPVDVAFVKPQRA